MALLPVSSSRGGVWLAKGGSATPAPAFVPVEITPVAVQATPVTFPFINTEKHCAGSDEFDENAQKARLQFFVYCFLYGLSKIQQGVVLGV
jgi:hypothetical protein